MAESSKAATFSVVLDDEVSGSADKAAESVEQLRARMATGEKAVKDMSAALRRLKGSTDEVKSAKDQLKAKINAEKDAISAAQIATFKHKDATGKLATAKQALSKVVGFLKEKFGGLKQGTDESSGGMGLAKIAALGLAAAFAAVVAASVGALIAFGKFIITGANAARSTGLLREAVAGNAKDAEALGSQVDALAMKVPMAKDAINELANSLVKGGVRGQTFVDTLNAVGQATSALGDEAGNKLKALIERGRIGQNFSVGNDQSEDLRGTGLQRDDVAAALAKNMNVGIDKAREALAEGRVKLADGAAAMKDAVEKKFGGLNLRKMLDLNVIAQKLHERFDAMTAGVNLEPLLQGFSDLAELFGENTVAGAGLKQIVTVFGGEMVKGFAKGIPLAKQFFKGLVIGALQAGIMFLTLRNWLKKTFGDNETLKGLFSLESALKAGALVAGVLVVGVAALGLALGVVLGALASVGGAFQYLADAGLKFGEWIRNVNWAELGTNIVDGLLDGIKSGADKLIGGVKSLAARIKGGFKDALGIHSPSKVFAGYGANTAEGFAQGVEAGTPAAAKSLDEMAARPSSGGAGSGGARGGVTVHMPINITVSGPDAAKQITDPGFLAQLTKALEDVLIGAGIPVRA